MKNQKFLDNLGISLSAFANFTGDDAASFGLTLLFNVMSAVKDELKSLLGNFMGLLLTLLDSYDVLMGCTGGEAVIRSLAFLYMATVLGLLFSVGLGGLPLIIIIPAMALLTLVVSVLKDAFLRCSK